MIIGVLSAKLLYCKIIYISRAYMYSVWFLNCCTETCVISTVSDK